MTKSTHVSGVATPAAGAQAEVLAGEGVGSAARAGRAARAAGRTRAAVGPRGPGTVSIDRLVQDVASRVRSAVLRLAAPRVWAVAVPRHHALSVAGYAAPRASGSRHASGTAAARAGSSGSARAGSSGSARTGSSGSARAGSSASATAGSGATATAKAASASASGGEWAFLDDPRLSIEDKLFAFMKLVIQKSNDDLEKQMKAYRSGKSGSSSGAASGSGQAKSSSGGLFGLLKKAFPPLAALEKVVPGLSGLVEKAVTQLGPELLGALMIPLGAPWAAPLVQKAAAALVPEAIQAVSRAVEGGSEGAAPATSGTSGASGSTGSKENDERLQLLEIERMMQKTNQMFSTVSNILKSAHDAAMTAVNNIR